MLHNADGGGVLVTWQGFVAARPLTRVTADAIERAFVWRVGHRRQEFSDVKAAAEGVYLLGSEVRRIRARGRQGHARVPLLLM